MIDFTQDEIRFTYRVAGIAIHDDHILLHRNANGGPWFLPGGRGELLEASQTTLIREVQEEMGTTVQIERLVWISEYLRRSADYNRHWLVFYYLITLPPDFVAQTRQTPLRFKDQGHTFEGHWLPLADVPALRLYPAFLAKRLHALPPQIEHIVTVEDD